MEAGDTVDAGVKVADPGMALPTDAGEQEQIKNAMESRKDIARNRLEVLFSMG